MAYWKTEKGYVIGSNGLEILPPLVIADTLSAKGRRNVLKKCMAALEGIMEYLDVPQCIFREALMDKGYTDFTRYMLESAGRISHVLEECYVDLTMPLDKIWQAMRETHRRRIKQSRDLWSARIIARHDDVEVIDETFHMFRSLHIEVAGRETRSIGTWIAQREALKCSDDFVILLYDKENMLIGASLYSATGTGVTYSVGAYRRELFDQPVAHYSHWLAIEHTREQHKRWYYIGQRPYQEDFFHPTDKEVTIGYFKEGFATNFYPTFYIEYERGGIK